MVKIRIFQLTIRKYYLLCILVAIVIVYTIIATKNIEHYEEHKRTTTPTYSYFPKANLNKSSEIMLNDLYTNEEVREIIMKQKIERLERKNNKSLSVVLNRKPMLKPNYNVHVFYYAWYGNIKIDGKYKHWDHKYLENWKKDDLRRYPAGKHRPPNDIGSNFYPYLGCYSSADPQVIDTHLKQISAGGIGVIVVSWAPPNFTDSPSHILPQLFNIALKYNVKISLQIEPYAGRNPINLMAHLKQFFGEFGGHPALYKMKKPFERKMLPVIYVYDSYLIPAMAWKELLSPKGNLSIRKTAVDAIYLGLLVDNQHKYHIKKSQFDGFYTYFATNSFTYGSTWKNWQYLSKFAVQNWLIFVPSVGPGYIDVGVRPWNTASTRHRQHGQYYDIAWQTAVNAEVNYVSITSFNEWHEGTQIEPASPRSSLSYTYLNYEPEGPYFYLSLTKSWVIKFGKLVE